MRVFHLTQVSGRVSESTEINSDYSGSAGFHPEPSIVSLPALITVSYQVNSGHQENL